MCAESFLARRLDGLQRALSSAGASGSPRPYVLIENSSKCNTNEAGDKVLPNGTVWLTALFQKVSVCGNTRTYICSLHFKLPACSHVLQLFLALFQTVRTRLLSMNT